MKIILLYLFVASSLYCVQYDKDFAGMLASSCVTCHSTSSVSSSGIPIIYGKSKEYIFSTLKDFKSGARKGLTMNKILSSYSNEELEQLSYYFSQSK